MDDSIHLCANCQQPRVEYHDALLCLNCDNRGGTLQAEWAQKWAEEYEGER